MINSARGRRAASLYSSSESALGFVVIDVARLTGALRLITRAAKYKVERIASFGACKQGAPSKGSEKEAGALRNVRIQSVMRLYS